ncbi:MAG TPA: HNH endonuclease [Fimbriiglobus sp.]|nr:HNH endonuclease [Fimbriiglobus sp.]
MNPRYAAVARRAGHRCEYCRAPEAAFNFPFEVEHVTPTSAGGSDAAANLALACRSCNLRKSDAVTGRDGQSKERLLHPREDRWPDHFRVDPDTGVIEGLTAIGRATIERLDLNHPLQLAARSVWARLGLYP